MILAENNRETEWTCPEIVRKPARPVVSASYIRCNVANGHDGPKIEKVDKPELTEDDCYEKLGSSFPWWKKWTILSVISVVQMSMNFTRPSTSTR